MTRPRIAYLLNRFPKQSETFVIDEILALERRGFPVAVCSLRPGSPSEAPAEAQHLVRDRICVGGPIGVEVLAAQFHWLLRAPYRLLGIWALAVVRHATSPRALVGAVIAVAHASVLAIRLPRLEVAHLHAHWATHSALAAWAIHRLSGLSYSFTTHADDLFVRRPMLEEKAAGARFVVAISEFGARFLRGELRDPDAADIRVVHCGVAADEYPPLPPPTRSGPFTIACVARLEPKKGHRVLLDACLLLAERGLDFRCVLVGDGRERPALERTCADPRLHERVAMLGERTRAEARQVIADAHVMVLPCLVAPGGRADGIPVALMEAMALQRPVVSTTVSGVPELVEDGHSGLLVAPDDALELADALERLHADPALAARLAAAGRRRIEEAFDIDRNVARLGAFFEAEAGGGKPAPVAVGAELRTG